jgi:hypothetical protein
VKTAGLPRFAFVDLFLRPATAQIAKDAYDEAVAGSEVYTLDRFGTGAIPFDLVIAGQGRGTIRLTSKALIVTTPEPKFVSLQKPIESISDLAEVTEKSFGPCALVGKAITLISMLAREFVFAFHEGASPYVKHTRRVHEILRNKGVEVSANPILRVNIHAWDAMAGTQMWVKLPEPLRGPFGADVVSGQTIAGVWRCVSEQQHRAVEALGNARNMTSLIDALHRIRGGRWETLAAEYASVRESLRPLEMALAIIRKQVSANHSRLRVIKREWFEAERQRGELFRKGKNAKRDALLAKIAALREERRSLRENLRQLRIRQAQEASNADAQAARERRREIRREAELARLRIAQESVIATAGMEKTNNRPAAWWFPVASPDGAWFRKTIEGIELRLEALAPAS